MPKPGHELRIHFWSDPVPAGEQLFAPIHALVPDAHIARGLTPNQLCVNLGDTDVSAVSALNALLQGLAELVYRYCSRNPFKQLSEGLLLQSV